MLWSKYTRKLRWQWGTLHRPTAPGSKRKLMSAQSFEQIGSKHYEPSEKAQLTSNISAHEHTPEPNTSTKPKKLKMVLHKRSLPASHMFSRSMKAFEQARTSLITNIHSNSIPKWSNNTVQQWDSTGGHIHISSSKCLLQLTAANYSGQIAVQKRKQIMKASKTERTSLTATVYADPTPNERNENIQKSKYTGSDANISQSTCLLQ